ncbi:hypothetical protein [Pseudomonas sp. S3E12]|jgi:hypothetical protein|uniref:hypothetical protein n=1 Tax=Pseudomonas sp. S3E12 TaxID=1873126 RepID=UPI001C46D43F|nr:hypothetical protein [Pseudomonas sp. S3E12]
MQPAKVQVADGLNGACAKIRRGLRRFFSAGGETSIAQGLAGLDEMFERRATDFRRSPR